MHSGNNEEGTIFHSTARGVVDSKCTPTQGDAVGAAVRAAGGDDEDDDSKLYDEMTPKLFLRPPTPRGKPPVVPGSSASSGEQPKSILKSRSRDRLSGQSPHSSKSRVSFKGDEEFSEPTLCFWTAKNAPGARPGVAAEGNSITAGIETRSNDAVAKAEVGQTLQSGTGSKGLPRYRVSSSPESPAAFLATPPYRGTQDKVQEARDQVVPEEFYEALMSCERPSTILDAKATEAYHTAMTHVAQEILPVIDVSVSDLTGSPLSADTQQCFLDGRESLTGCGAAPAIGKHDTPAAAIVAEFYSPVDEVREVSHSPSITPIPLEVRCRSSTLSDGGLSPFLLWQHQFSVDECGASPPSQELQSQATLIGNRVDAIVESPRPSSHIPASATSLSSSPSPPQPPPLPFPPEENTHKQPFEGGVDPDDLVFDDSLQDIIMEMGDVEDDHTVVEVPYDQKVVRCSLQNYPHLALATEDGPRVTVTSLASRVFLSDAADNENSSRGAGLHKYGGRKGHHQVASAHKPTAPLHPVLRGVKAREAQKVVLARSHVLTQAPHNTLPNHLGSIASDVQAAAAAAVVAAAAAAAAEEKEVEVEVVGNDQSCILRVAHNSSAGDGAPPVVVEHVNELSTAWQEALRDDGDDNTTNGNNVRGRAHTHCSSFPSDMNFLLQHEKNTRKLLPGFSVVQSPGMTHTDGAISLGEKEPDASPLIPVKRMEVVLPKSAESEKMCKPIDDASVVATTPSDHNVDCVQQQGQKTGGANKREKSDVEPGEFEDVESCDIHQMRAMSPAPFTAATSGVKEQPVYQRRIAEAACTLLGTEGSEMGGDKSSGRRKRRSRPRHDWQGNTEIELKRAELHETLRSALLLLAGEDVVPSLKGTDATRPHRPSHGHDPSRVPVAHGGTTAEPHNRQHTRPPRRTLLPPPLSPPSSPPSATTEGLIRTPEHVMLRERRAKFSSKRSRVLLAPARSTSPLGLVPHGDGDSNGDEVGRRKSSEPANLCGAMLELRVTDCKVLKTFARDVGGIVTAFRNSNLVKMF